MNQAGIPRPSGLRRPVPRTSGQTWRKCLYISHRGCSVWVITFRSWTRPGVSCPGYGSGPPESYDQVVRLTWDFWRNMRNCPNGVPMYLAATRSGKPDQEDPSWLGRRSDQHGAVVVEPPLRLSGDPAVKAQHDPHGRLLAGARMSGPKLLWANLPYPYNLTLHSGEYDGDMRAGKGFVQPDKAGSFAWELVGLYR